MPQKSNASPTGEMAKKQGIILLLIHKLMALPPLKATGQFFYNIGFATEMVSLKVWRTLRDGGIFFSQMITWLFGGLGKGIANGFKSFWKDLAAPFKNTDNNLRRTKESMNKRRERAVEAGEGEETAAQPGYIGSRARGLLLAILNILRYLLPIAALLALAVTVNSLLSFRYTLAVEMDGRLIGYISDEMVLQEAVNVVKGRIKASDGKTGEDWQPEGISLRVSNVGSVSNKSQLINNILHVYTDMTHKDDALIVASGLHINGELYAVTTEPNEVREFLSNMLEENSSDDEDVSVSFVKDVEIDTGEDEYYFASSVSSYNELAEKLSSVEYPAVYHKVGRNETAESIAMMYNITLDRLISRNAGVNLQGEDGAGQEFLPEGMQLVIEREKYFLQVKKTMQVSYEETVPYSVVEQETANKVKGSRVKINDGSNGVDLVYDDLVYVDGELVDRIRISEKTQQISAPVNELWEIGTFEFQPGTEGQISAYIWPVPDYKDVSRGWIPGVHKGLDITAAAGTPIIASNFGEVTLASWWVSYGNCVVLKHADGKETLYGHMIAINVAIGDIVNPGDVIGFVGSTGRSTGNHLHFEVRIDGQRTDPAQFVTRPPKP